MSQFFSLSLALITLFFSASSTNILAASRTTFLYIVMIDPIENLGEDQAQILSFEKQAWNNTRPYYHSLPNHVLLEHFLQKNCKKNIFDFLDKVREKQETSSHYLYISQQQIKETIIHDFNEKKTHIIFAVMQADRSQLNDLLASNNRYTWINKKDLINSMANTSQKTDWFKWYFTNHYLEDFEKIKNDKILNNKLARQKQQATARLKQRLRPHSN